MGRSGGTKVTKVVFAFKTFNLAMIPKIKIKNININENENVKMRKNITLKLKYEVRSINQIK